MANVYGVNIPFPDLSPTVNRLGEEVVKKREERKIFLEFLETRLSGRSISEEIYGLAKEMALSLGTPEVSRQEVVEAVIREYKRQKNFSGFSAYDQMVFALIEKMNGQRDLIEGIRRGKTSFLDVPRFPGLRKKAEVLLEGKIAGDLKPKDIGLYLIYKNYASLLRDYARDLFFVINQGGREKAVEFLQLMHALRKTQTSEPIIYQELRGLAFDAFVKKSVVELVHIKSLRFTYPGGRNLRVLKDTVCVKQDGLPGETRVYPSEAVIFQRLRAFEKIFRDSGISTQMTVIVSDSDLDYCFPEGQDLVPPADVLASRIAAKEYVKFLQEHHGNEARIRLLSEYLSEGGIHEEFDRVFDEVLEDESKGGDIHVKPKVLEMRVSEQFEHYQKMFGSYSRFLARFTATRQIANLLALSVVFNSFPNKPLLVIDSRGFENELIGGYDPGSVIKFFTKLKDPVVIGNGKIERR